jgi:hypothetical protein
MTAAIAIAGDIRSVLMGMAFCPHERGDGSFDMAFAALVTVIGPDSGQNPRGSSPYAAGVCMI